MRVAIIDDGVDLDSDHLKLENYKVHNGKVVLDAENKSAKFSHGTMCAKIITHNVRNVRLISISISSEFSDGTESDLIIALKWCLKNNIDLINLSNGATSYFDNEKLNDICYCLWKKGTVIVAAISNTWEYTVPANLPYVLGVSRRRLIRNTIIPDIEISGWHFFEDRKGRKHIETYNSFACARLSNKLIRRKLSKRKLTYGKKRKLNNIVYNFSLLKDVYLWGTADLEKNQFIQSYPWIDKEQWQVLPDGVNVVVLDNYVLNELDEFIKSGKIRQLIWCNNYIPKKIKAHLKRAEVMLWQPYYTKNEKKSNKVIVEDNFSIIVNCTEIKSFEYIHELYFYFIQKGYNVLMFSKRKYTLLYGAIPYINFEYINECSKMYNPDVILIDGDDNTRNLEADLNIYVKTDKINLVENGDKLFEANSMAEIFCFIINNYE